MMRLVGKELERGEEDYIFKKIEGKGYKEEINWDLK